MQWNCPRTFWRLCTVMGHSLEQVHREFSDDLWIHNGVLISLGIVFHFVVEFFNRFRHFFQPIAMQLFILGFNTFKKGGIWETLRFWSNFVYRNRAWEMYKQIDLEKMFVDFLSLIFTNKVASKPQNSLIAPSNLQSLDASTQSNICSPSAPHEVLRRVFLGGNHAFWSNGQK